MTNRSLETRAADHIILHCGALEHGERVVVIGDDETADIASLFAARATEFGGIVDIHVIAGAHMHGQEPPPQVADAMIAGDLIVGLTTMSLAHTQARYQATQRGARYLSMPDYSWDILRDRSMFADYRAVEPEVERIADAFTKGSLVHASGSSGTDIRIKIQGRSGNACPGTVRVPGALGSPPDIEANVAPLENGSDGIVIVDGSIPCREIGLLSSPIVLTVVAGSIEKIEGEDTRTVATLQKMFDAAGPRSRILAECGIGLNREARLQGKMLTDEGAFGCLHFGFGANATIGGENRVPFHLDFVFRSGSLSIDGRAIMKNGLLVEG